MEEISKDRCNSTDAKDYFGFPLTIGDRVLRAFPLNGSSAYYSIHTITKMQSGRIYLDDSKKPMNFPGRLINISYIRTAL